MKKSLIAILLVLFFGMFVTVQAEEIKVSGTGSALISGYNIKYVRAMQDKKMQTKSENSNIEAIQTQQIKEASRQAETRKKQDERTGNALRRAIIDDAQTLALKNALNNLIDMTVGVNASKNPKIIAVFDNLYSQFDSCITDRNYTGEVRDNTYIAKVDLTVDNTTFREKLSQYNIDLYTQKVRSSSILLVLDEFFCPPSDLTTSVLTKETTTYNYKKNESYKNNATLKASSSSNHKSSSAGAYVGWTGAGVYGSKHSSGAKSAVNYKHNEGYSDKENEFYQNIKEYQPKNPHIDKQNNTLPALVNVFNKMDINSKDNSMFKSLYFKGQPITSDKLKDSAQLASYVKYAKDTARADYFGIGTSVIVDNGKNADTGMNTASGVANVAIFSTLDGTNIASGTVRATSSGDSADDARAAVAQKIGNELGENLASSIQNYAKNRMMKGSEYILVIKGNFLPAERINITKNLKNVSNIQNVTLKTMELGKLEYSINYNGEDPVGDAIFLQLTETNLANKFNHYDYSIHGNQVIFTPIVKKGTSNL